MKLPLSTLASTVDINGDTEEAVKQAAVAFERWLSEKREAKRKLEQERLLLEEAVERERQKKIEIEKKNYDNWIAAKSAESKRKIQAGVEKLEAKKRIADKERQKKKLENELSYQLWCKRKEEEFLGKRYA